ncbi:MAG: FecR domain-containing protein, partial [Novosphingobium sp.]
EVQRVNRIRDPRRIPVGARIAIPRRLLRWTPVELRVANFSGPVSVVLASGMVPPQRAMVVGEGAELATGSNGFVTLTGADGSRVSLPSHSRARVRQSRRYLINDAATLEFEVLQGRADVSAAKQKPDGQFRLRTPAAVTAVRGTEFRVGYVVERDTGYSEVLEGLVAVAGSAASADVAAGYGIAAKPGSMMVKERLLPAPVAITPGKVQTEEALRFALQPVDGAQGYRVQVARDAGFLDTIAEQVAPATEVELSGIGNGRLFMRASAIAASGLEGHSETWSFRRQRVGVKAEGGPVADGYRFAWLAEGEGSSLYRFQLYRTDRPQTPLIDNAGMTDTSITTTGLARGVYAWRVGVTQTTADGAAQVWTPAQKFTVSE